MAEQRLIEAEALYKKVLESHVTNIDGYSYINHNRVLKMIDNEPTVDAKPVVHAHWEPKKIMARTPFARNFYCSNCKDEPLECKHICGNCGAQMDEKEDKK